MPRTPTVLGMAATSVSTCVRHAVTRAGIYANYSYSHARRDGTGHVYPGLQNDFPYVFGPRFL